MAFDKPTRNRLASFVGDARDLIAKEFTQQFQSIYGISEKGDVTPLDQLREHLDDAGLSTATLLRERIEYLVKTHPEEKEGKKAAVDRLAREQAFTILNRLAALRMAEKRDLIVESVGKGYQSKGFKVFEQVAGSGLGDTYQRYRRYLFCLFDELAVDLGVLFDRSSPQGLLFPREPALLDLLKLLNAPELEVLWGEDETIGWIYQYYNDPAERKKMREAGAPRNSRELAVRNQFFTPRYVVEFLTDNTLGRIWYEMTRGQTRLIEQCRYMVRRPKEIFLGDPAQAEDTIFGKPEERYSPNPPVAAAFQGNLTEISEAVGFDPRWISVAIPPDQFEKITGEPYRGLYEDDRLSQVIEAACTDQDSLLLKDIPLFWAALSKFTLGDHSRRYSAERWEKCWQRFVHEVKAKPTDGQSQEDYLKEPLFIPYRPIKDPREIRMLDPACGSMHFGLYAFDLYEVIYDEAWEIAQGNDTATKASTSFTPFVSFAANYSDKAAFLAGVPRLIVENNIHGIDIDPRCTQIAGLSLWLRAQKSWQSQKVPPVERPRIRRSNVVCAEPMPGDKAMLRDFVQNEFSASERPAFSRLLEAIFDKMQLAGEAGSLLKIEEEIRSAVEEARKLWESAQTKARELFDTEEFNRTLRPGTQQELAGLERAVSQVAKEFWDTAEERIYAALRDYAEQAEDDGGFQRRLFAEDAARGFALIDICRKRHDAVVMNPPFGESSDLCLDYFDRLYSTWNANMLCASLQRAWEMTSNIGAIGAIYDRTAIVKSSYEDFRRAVLVEDDRLASLADLGWEVLDANVEVTTSVLSRVHVTPCVFLDVRNAEPEQKGIQLLHALRASQTNEGGTQATFVRGSDFQRFPNAVIGYDFPEFLRRAFEDGLSLNSSGYSAFTGHQFKTVQHFRLWWEISLLTPPPFLARLFNGAGFCPFWAPLRDVLISEVDLDQLPKNSSTNLRNREQHLRPGICFGKRGEYFCAHVLPSGHFFSLEGLAIPVRDRAVVLEMLGVLNTPLTRSSLNKFAGQHKTSGYVNLFPYRRVPDSETVRTKVQAAVLALLHAQRFDETLSLFQGIRQTETIKQLAAIIDDGVQEGMKHTLVCEKTSHDLVLASYGVLDSDREVLEAFRLRQPKFESPLEDADIDGGCNWFASHSTISFWFGCAFGRWDIRYATDEKATQELPDPFAPLPVCPPGQLQNGQGLPARPEDVPAAYPIHIPWDGILVDDPNHPLDIERRIRGVMETIWKDRAESIEHEACEIIGVKSLRDYFRKPSGFFADHLKRYSKNRRQAPIYWPLATASGSYTLWIYYHRLTANTLHAALADFIDPKLKSLHEEISFLRNSGKQQARLEELSDLEQELQDFRTEIERIIKFPWKPNLNDGVLITASPLWKLFRLAKWQKDVKACWEELSEGEYDWAHLAYTIWPERVEEVCKTDRSIAIAQGLEHLCKVKATKPKKKRSKKDREASFEDLDA